MMNTMTQPAPRPKMSMGFPTMQPMVGAAPTGVMPTAPAPAGPAPAPMQPQMQPPPQQPMGADGHMHGPDMMKGGDHIPGRFARIPGMSDLVSQFFSNGGDMHGLHEQARAYGQSAAGGPNGMGGILRTDAPGFLDYLRAHLGGAAPAAAPVVPAPAPVIPPVVGG